MLKTHYLLIVITFYFIYFCKKKKSDSPENLHTYSEKYIENKEITFLENVKKIKNIPILLKVADPRHLR